MAPTLMLKIAQSRVSDVIGKLALDVIHLRGQTPGSVALALRPVRMPKTRRWP
jgi:hypothetical protein